VRVAITGGTGMIGTALGVALRERGDEVLVITRRRPASPDQVRWDTSKGIGDLGRLEGVDAVVHLAGQPLAGRPWTKARRRNLLASRVDATRTLHQSLAKLDQPPTVYLGVGHLGRFGDRGEEVVHDDAPVGTGFLAELSTAWEDAHNEAVELGCRVAVLRMSIVLSATGSVFPLMVKPFRIGVGGWLGPGQQFTPWISIRDAVGGFLHLLDHSSCEGSYNGTVPEPVRSKEFFMALGRALQRRVRVQAPRWALRGAFGELADDILLSSIRAVPTRLLDSGYTFVDTDIEATYTWLLQELKAQ